MAKELAVGDRAPAFKLLTDTGEISSADLKGRAYVLYFYPKDDTPGCTKEAIAFSENAAKLWLKPMAFGSKKNYTAASIWAWTALRSWSTTRV